MAAVKQQDDRSHSSAARLRGGEDLREVAGAALIRWKRTASEALRDKSVPPAPEARGRYPACWKREWSRFRPQRSVNAARSTICLCAFFFFYIYKEIHEYLLYKDTLLTLKAFNEFRREPHTLFKYEASVI